MWKYVVGILVVVVAALVGFMAYVGMFLPLKVVEMQTGPYPMLYVNHTGDYAATGKVFEQVNAIAAKENLTPSKGIGIYLDDPKTVAKEKLRSQIGFVLEGKDLKRAAELKNKKYTLQTISAAKSLVVEFPMKNTLSYMVGAIRVYPVLMQYATANNIKISRVLEIYDMQTNKILYIVQIDQCLPGKCMDNKCPDHKNSTQKSPTNKGTGQQTTSKKSPVKK